MRINQRIKVPCIGLIEAVLIYSVCFLTTVLQAIYVL